MFPGEGCQCSARCESECGCVGVDWTDTRVVEARNALTEWAEKQGHDRCWYYPDILNRLCEILGIPVFPQPLPPRAEFEAGCCRYQNEQYKGIRD
jgi:hypothetical protein